MDPLRLGKRRETKHDSSRAGPGVVLIELGKKPIDDLTMRDGSRSCTNERANDQIAYWAPSAMNLM